jgi:hypothetical protein
MTSLVKYGSFDLSELEKQNAKIENTGSSTGADFMKLAQGRNRVRFLPPAPGQKSPFAVVSEHYVIAKNGQGVSFACPRAEGMPCPACDEFFRLKKSSNPLDQDDAKKYRVRTRVYANVIDRDKPDAPRILTFPKTVWSGLMRILRDTEEGGDFTNPTDEGFDIIITREGTGKLDTSYAVNASRSASPLADTAEQINNILENQYDLSRYTSVPSLDEVLAMMQDGHEGRKAFNEKKQLAPPKTETIQNEAFGLDDDDVPY